MPIRTGETFYAIQQNDSLSKIASALLKADPAIKDYYRNNLALVTEALSER